MNNNGLYNFPIIITTSNSVIWRNGRQVLDRMKDYSLASLLGGKHLKSYY